MIKNFGYKVFDFGGTEITTTGFTLAGSNAELLADLDSEKFIVLNGLNVNGYGKIAPCSPVMYTDSTSVKIVLDKTYYIEVTSANLVKLVAYA